MLLLIGAILSSRGSLTVYIINTSLSRCMLFKSTSLFRCSLLQYNVVISRGGVDVVK